MNKWLLSLMLAACSFGSIEARPTVLTLKESIQDSTIVYPESFETDTQKLLQNWYLKDYAVLDSDSENAADVPTSKEDFISRLQNLPTVIEMPYNQVVRSYIDMYTQRRRALVEEMLGLSIYYMPIFEQALEKEGMPLELKYLPVIESALNPDAVSRVGATGLWQFMLGTAKGLGLEVNSIVDERRDPIRSSELAAKYLKQLYGMYGDWSLAIASYNCGPGNINKALRRAGGGKKDFWDIYYYLPAETRGYVPAFIAANYVMTYYQDHNIGKALARRPVLTDTVKVNKRVHFDQISAVLDIPVEELRVLNPQYRRDEIPGDIHPYTLTLPSKQIYSYIVSEDSIVSHNAALYARRSEVKPTEISSGTKLVVKYHTVKRGETLSKVARKYGVTTSAIKKWNRLRRNTLRRGQRLKINTYIRVDKPVEEEPEEQETTTLASNETQKPAVEQKEVAETETTVDNDEEPAEESEQVAKPEPKPAKKKAEKKAAEPSEPAKYHKVRSGESLGSISEKYGVTIAQLKDWNGLRSNRINAGQRLKLYSSAEPDNDDVAEKPAKKEKAKAKTHTVKRGETLSSIADRYGVTINDLKEWNDISGSSINAGQKLAVADNGKKASQSMRDKKTTARNKSSKTHTVRSGETLGEIAERYGTTASAIRRANGIKGSNIRAGQKLKIPRS